MSTLKTYNKCSNYTPTIKIGCAIMASMTVTVVSMINISNGKGIINDQWQEREKRKHICLNSSYCMCETVEKNVEHRQKILYNFTFYNILQL